MSSRHCHSTSSEAASSGGCGAAPWPPLVAPLVRAAIGPWRHAPQHAAVRHAPQPWMEDGVRHVV
jgi:hypothetical protein